MPITAPKIYPRVFHASHGLGLRDVVAFMIDDHASLTGPGWSIVEAYDGATASRQVPSITTGTGALASFTGTFSWKDNTVSPNDWIVLECNEGTNFQVYFEYATTTTIQYIMFPYADFVTGGGAVSPPTFPARAVGSTTSVVTQGFCGVTWSWWSVIADEQMMALVTTQDGKTCIEAGYIGSVSNPLPSDTRPFVIYDVPSVVRLYDGSGGTYWNRVSPVDDTTIIGSGYYCWHRLGNDNRPVPVDTTHWLDEQPLFPIGVMFTDTGHSHFAGFLRNVYGIHRKDGYRNVYGTKAYIVASDNKFDAALAWPWDNTTDW
jgi:hypothetical protein